MTENPPNKLKFLLNIPLLGLLLAAIGLGSFLWWNHSKTWVWTNDAYIEGYNVQVSSDIEARITHMYVDEGDFVKAGAPILELKRDILDAKKIEAITHISLLEETVKQKKVFKEKLQDNYLIAKEEFEKEIISFLDYDHKEKDFQMAALEHKIAEKELENGSARLGVIEAQLSHTRVYAPRDGVIAKRWILPGDVATIGQPLFELNQLDGIWVTANLEETKLHRIKVGDKVKIKVDTYPDKEFSGKVWVIKASAASKFALIPPNNATGNFTKVVQRIPVKIRLDPSLKDLYLFPGMSCEVSIKVK